MRLSSSIPLVAIVPIVLGNTHYFFSGYFNGTTIARVQFDDLQNTLTLVNNITVPTLGNSIWITLDV